MISVAIEIMKAMKRCKVGDSGHKRKPLPGRQQPDSQLV